MSSKARSSASMSGKDSLRNKKKLKPSPGATPMSISSLPHDLLLNCLSRLYHPTLSFVCKKFRSIVKSLELYKTRSLLKCTEKCLYLCLRFPLDPQTHWFTLCKKIKTKKTSGFYRFNKIRSPQGLLPCQSSSLVAVGSNIYKIGGADSYRIEIFGKRPSSSFVSVLDCCSHTWKATRRMQVDRNSSSTASLVEGKIYVAGGCRDSSSLNWVEVFDPNTESWSSITNPNFKGPVVKSLGHEGKFYLFGYNECVVYDPKESRWNHSGMRFSVDFCYGVIDKVLFVWHAGVFQWYDSKVSIWKKLNGLERLPDFRASGYWKMVDLGGKMAVLWDHCVSSEKNMIWCCEIVLEKRHGDDGDEIWGKVKWFDVVLRIGAECSLQDLDVISATV